MVLVMWGSGGGWGGGFGGRVPKLARFACSGSLQKVDLHQN